MGPITSNLPHWLWPGDDRPTDQIDDEITEELRFHLEMLAEDCERDGMEGERATRRAAERFGDFDQILRRCRVEKQGDVPMLKRTQTILTVLLLILVLFLGVRDYVSANTSAQYMTQTTQALRTIQSDLAKLHDGLPVPTGVQPIAAPATLRPGVTFTVPNGENVTLGEPIGALNNPSRYMIVKKDGARGDVTGVVTGADGEPIEGADVLLILKDWPNNRYRQRDRALKTDAEGRFTMKRAVPLDGQYGVNAAIVAPGHAIASRYVLVEEPGGEAPTPLDFKLTESATFRLNLTDARGDPLAKALVAPAGRNDSENENHLVYHQGSNPTWRKADAEGVVEIDWFATGDIGEVRVRQRGGEWQEVRVETPAAGEEVKRTLEHWK